MLSNLVFGFLFFLVLIFYCEIHTCTHMLEVCKKWKKICTFSFLFQLLVKKIPPIYLILTFIWVFRLLVKILTVKWCLIFCWVEFLRIPKFLIVGNNLLLLVSNFIAIFSVTENNKCYHLDFCPIFFTCVFETVSDFITLIIFVTFIIRLIQEKKSKIKRYLQMFWFLVFYELSHNSKITIVSNILLISVYVLYTYL